jgi:hypothetical protein
MKPKEALQRLKSDFSPALFTPEVVSAVESRIKNSHAARRRAPALLERAKREWERTPPAKHRRNEKKDAM